MHRSIGRRQLSARRAACTPQIMRCESVLATSGGVVAQRLSCRCCCERTKSLFQSRPFETLIPTDSGKVVLKFG